MQLIRFRYLIDCLRVLIEALQPVEVERKGKGSSSRQVGGDKKLARERVNSDKMLLLLIYVFTSLDFLLQRLPFELSLLFLPFLCHSTFPLLFSFCLPLPLSFSHPSACIVRVFPALKPFPLHFSLPYGDKLCAPSGAQLLQANKCLIELFTALS